MADGVNRRKVLQMGGLLVASSIAGCGVSGDTEDDIEYTRIVVQNQSDHGRWIGITVLDPEGDNRKEATWFSEEIPLDEHGGDSGQDIHKFDQAFETRRAIVIVESPEFGEQFDYFPHCTDEDGRDDFLSIKMMTRTSIRWWTGCED